MKTGNQDLPGGYAAESAPLGWDASESVRIFAARLATKTGFRINAGGLYYMLADNIRFLSMQFDEVIALIMTASKAGEQKGELFREICQVLQSGPNREEIRRPPAPPDPAPAKHATEDKLAPDWNAQWFDDRGQHSIATWHRGSLSLIQYRVNGVYAGEVKYCCGDAAIRHHFDKAFQAAQSPNELIEWFHGLCQKFASG